MVAHHCPGMGADVAQESSAGAMDLELADIDAGERVRFRGQSGHDANGPKSGRGSRLIWLKALSEVTKK